MSASAGRVLLIFKGEYSPSAPYSPMDVVLYEGDSYVCQVASTGNLPTNTSYFKPFTQTGAEISELETAFVNNVNVNGSKNVLPIICQDGTRQGITISNNGEYLTVSGTASGNPTTISLFDEDLVPVSSSYGTAKTLKELGIDNTKKYIFSRPSSAGNIRYGIWLFNGSTKLTDLELNNETLEIDFPNTYPTCDRLKFSLAVTSGAVVSSGTAFKPMFCLKTDYDFDSTWVPFASPNRVLSKNKVSWSDEAQIGAVNELNNTATTQIVESEVTFTVNDDKSVTASWSSITAQRELVLCGAFTLTNTRRLSGCPSGGGNTTHRLYAVDSSSHYYSDDGNGIILPPGSYKSVRMVIFTGASSPLTFKPMITPVSYNGPYVPRAMTNKELTDELEVKRDTTTISNVYCYRQGKVVTINIQGSFSITAGQNNNIGTLPSEFRPNDTNVRMLLFTNDAPPKLTNCTIYTDGTVQINGWQASGTLSLYGQITYIRK